MRAPFAWSLAAARRLACGDLASRSPADAAVGTGTSAVAMVRGGRGGWVWVGTLGWLEGCRIFAITVTAQSRVHFHRAPRKECAVLCGVSGRT